MSKLKSSSRKLNVVRVHIAKQTQLKKHELAMTIVAERVKTDVEFAKDVLLIGGKLLREDIKKSAHDTIENFELTITDKQRAELRSYMKENGLQPMVPDGGCSAVDVPVEELQAALEDSSKIQTQRLKDAGLV